MSEDSHIWFHENINLDNNSFMMNISRRLNTNSSHEYSQFADIAQFITGTICYPVICILGIFCNSFCLAVFHRSAMHSSTNSYLTALAIGDLAKLTNDLVYFPAVLLKNMHTSRSLYTIYYPGGYFLSQYLSTVTAWLTVMVTFERFLMIVHPRRVHGRLSSSRARNHCIAVYLVLLVLTSPCAFRYRTACQSNGSTTLWPSGCANQNSTILLLPNAMWSQPKWRFVFSAIQGSIQSLLPLSVLILLNLRIIVVLHAPRANKRLLLRHHLTRMLFVVVAAFILLTTPDAIISVLGWGYHEEGTGLIKGVREITDTLLAFNSDIHFFIYVGFNQKFRNHLLNLIPFCGRPLPGNTTMTEPTAILKNRTTEIMGKFVRTSNSVTTSKLLEEQIPLRHLDRQNNTDCINIE